MKKTLASVLTLLLVVLMVFAGVVPAVTYAAESEPAPKSNSVTEAVSSVADWFSIEQQGNELIVTFNPDVDAIAQLDAAAIKNVLNKLLAYAKGVVSTTLHDEAFREELWQIAYEAYLQAKGYDSITDAIEDPELTTELLGYARDVIVAAHRAGIIDAQQLKLCLSHAKSKALALLSKAKDALDAKLSAYVDAQIDKLLAKYDITEEQLDVLLGLSGDELTAKLLEYGIDSDKVDELKDLVTSGALDTEVSYIELFNLVENVSINGYSVYNAPKDAKAEIDLGGIKNLLLSVPGFGEISNMTNEQMQESLFSLNVEVTTAYGTSSFDLTAKVGNGAEYIRAAARLLDKYITLNVENGVIVFELNVPEIFTKALLKAANSESIDPVLKSKVFTAFMATGDDVHAFIQSLSYDDLLALLGYVDFDALFDNDFINKFVDLSQYDDEDVDRVVKQYRGYFEAAIKYGIRLTNAVANRIPDKYMDNSFLDLIEYEDSNDKFSYSNGSFRYQGTHTITYEHLEYLVSTGAGLVGVNKDFAASLLAFLPTSFQKNGYTLSVDFRVNFEKLNRIDYVVDGKVVKSGFLPAGAKVGYFINLPGVLQWADEYGNIVTEMPDRDVVLTAVEDAVVLTKDNFKVVYESDHNQLVSYVYNGKLQSVNKIVCTLDGVDITEYISYNVVCEPQLNAGTYTVTVQASVKAGYENQFTLEESVFELEWEISKKDINVSKINVQWSPNNVFTYNGTVQTPWIVITGSLDDVFSSDFATAQNLAFVLTGAYVFTDANGNVVESPVDAGTYFAEAAVVLANGYDNNYSISGAAQLPKIEWTIEKKSVNVSGFDWSWDYLAAYVYNREAQEVKLNIDGKLPEGLTVVYTGNKATDAGDYIATATIVPDGNHEIVGTIPELSISWKIDKALIDDSSLVFADTTVDYDYKPHKLELTGNPEILKMLEWVIIPDEEYVLLGTYTFIAKVKVNDEYSKNYVYTNEFTAKLTITGNKKFNLQIVDGNQVIVSIDAPKGFDADLEIVGGKVQTAEDLYVVGKSEFKVLAAYTISFTKGVDGEAKRVGGQLFKVRLLVPEEYQGAKKLSVLNIKKDGTVEVIEATYENGYMCFETNNPVATYAVVRDERVNLTLVWVLLVLILVGGIAAGIYFYMKGKKNDEPETTTEAAEEPVAPVAPVAPEVTEEPVAEEEPVVEEPAPIVVEEPKTAVLVMGEDGKEATAIIGGETVHIRFRSSFMSRLIQSSENIQDFYTAIKNHVLSYKGIKARSSWNYEAFNKGRVQLVKLNIKGKTLIVNLNLDPQEFNINKYHFIDCSDKPKFAKVPMMMKVRSARALKYTLELIDEMMKKYELTQGEVPTVDYRMPYETTEELAKRGLVKVILPAGVTLSDDMTFVQVNVSELIESGANVKTTEQFMANDNLVVEDAPVTPKVEILEDGTVHADAEFADQLISDEEAEAKIEIVSVASGSRTGKFGEINLDVICENFEDGEVVDVDTLKAKHLISSKTGRVKVLARGIMYKKLTIKASKFSLQAVKMITLAGGKVELEE